MARNVAALRKYHWVMQTSLLKTLASKHKITTTQVAKKLRATTDTPYGPMTVYRVTVTREGRKPLVAEFGGVPLRKQEVTELRDRPYHVWAKRSELVTRLLKQECEMCGRTNAELVGVETRRVKASIEVHHKRKLADLKPKGRGELPEWKKKMIAMRRKTLIVCIECHDNIHAGRPCRPRRDEESEREIVSGEPDALKGARPVCAVRRVVANLLQAGRNRKEVLGSPHLPGVERQRGQEHVRKAVDVPRRCSTSRRKTRALW
jgi:hypothetical protein